MDMSINHRTVKVHDDVVEYRRRQYPLSGATATYTEIRRGIPLLSRRTIATVTVSGPGWQITGRSGTHGFLLRRAVSQFNEKAAAFSAETAPASDPA